jgi:hypothetical protein
MKDIRITGSSLLTGVGLLGEIQGFPKDTGRPFVPSYQQGHAFFVLIKVKPIGSHLKFCVFLSIMIK